MIDRAWIAARIPHQGSMCLLDAVELGRTTDRLPRHQSCPARQPVTRRRQLAANAIEYAAQAMAVHWRPARR